MDSNGNIIYSCSGGGTPTTISGPDAIVMNPWSPPLFAPGQDFGFVLRPPDFYEAGGGFNTPWIVGGEVAVRADRCQYIYISPGVTGGIPGGGAHGAAGWVLPLNNPLAAPTEAQIQGTLTSWSLGGGGGHFVGGGASGNNVGIAVAVGVYTPGQATGGFSWGFGPYGPFHALPKYGRCTK